MLIKRFVFHLTGKYLVVVVIVGDKGEGKKGGRLNFDLILFKICDYKQVEMPLKAE